MVLIDITTSEFVEVSGEEGDKWMNDNVGEVDPKLSNPYDSRGEGWRCWWDDSSDKWWMEIDDAAKASYFILRWS